MKRRRRESALNDFLDALASKKAGGVTGDSFSGIDLNGESLSGVDFCRCVFDNSVFYECDLSRANLGETSLQNTDFRKSRLLSRKNLSGTFDIRHVDVNLAEAKKGATVAVKVTDRLGEEVLVVKPL